MISIIICSINKAFAQQVQKNIAATIGVVWEVIVIDNTVSHESLTAVYNRGAARAQYELLCFMHEDILFETPDWGVIVSGYFNSGNNVGLIGVAGSKYKSLTPSGWFTGIEALDCCNITHLDKAGLQQNIYLNPSPGSIVQEVVVLDGVFLCCPKKIWEAIPFDAVLLKDFHLYDLDFSFAIAQAHKVLVTYQVSIVHITKGAHYGNKWLESTLLWHTKMKKKLPAGITGNVKNNQFENSILRTWLIRLKHENLSFKNKLQWLSGIKIWSHATAWPNVFLFVVKSFFNKQSK